MHRPPWLHLRHVSDSELDFTAFLTVAFSEIEASAFCRPSYGAFMVEGHECSGERLPEGKRTVHPTDYPAGPWKRPEKALADILEKPGVAQR